MLACAAAMYADVRVQGRVIDDAGEPMIGVNVVIQGTVQER